MNIPTPPNVVGWRSAITALFTAAFISTATAEVAVQSGDKIAFYGDSITVGGWANITGYVRRVMAGLEASGVQADAVPAGIRGAWSGDLRAALESNVLSKKPRWMILSCGADELWPEKSSAAQDAPVGGGGGATSSLENYKQNISEIVTKAQAAGIQVVILTVTGNGDDPANPENLRLAPYNDFLRALAKEKNLRLADLNRMFQERIAAEKATQEPGADGKKPGSTLRGPDGVHMRFGGGMLMASGILQAFGLDAEQVKKAQAVWNAEMDVGRAAKAAMQAREKAVAGGFAKDKAAADEAAARQAAAHAKAEEAAKIKATAAAKAAADAEKIKAQRTAPVPPATQ